MVAQRRLGEPLRLAALKFVFAAEALELGKSKARLPGPQNLDLPNAHAVGEKGLDHAGLVEEFKHRRLERGPARLVVGGGASLDDPRLHAMADEFACREQARRPRPDDEDLSFRRRIRPLLDFARHVGVPPVYTCISPRPRSATTPLPSVHKAFLASVLWRSLRSAKPWDISDAGRLTAEERAFVRRKRPGKRNAARPVIAPMNRQPLEEVQERSDRPGNRGRLGHRKLPTHDRRLRAPQRDRA